MTQSTLLSNSKSLSEFDEDLAKLHMRGQWQYDSLVEKLKDGPLMNGKPFIWHWNDVHPKLVEACSVMPESSTARRNFTFMNPELRGGATTLTLAMGMQIVVPGEVAWSHRHSIGALRFVIDGDPSLYSAVDGEKLPMETNDLILTPANTWHDHHNESAKSGVWLDVLDLPLVIGLNQTFYETYGSSAQPLRPRMADYISDRAASLLRPAWEIPQQVGIPFRYRWADVKARLQELADLAGSPYDGVLLHYANPVTGGSTLPTIDCFVQLMHPSLETKAHRHTSSSVYYVIEGEGTTIVGDYELNWSSKDAFVVPNWMWHRHINRSKSNDALLFSATDTPALHALGLYREEPGTSLFSAMPPPVPAGVARKPNQ